ncbi:hypothetical protein COMA1_30395 [Candidatus Nitrospira nitrosa]|uniref:Uncharacterized protein n=1 Tax=Candidatus Nitrospira nitrosa TaxID=1742972 RepID=A0A0S4LHQ5_9BACT|nr:hypothetical protein [Candidatus Nitrospira nitrosa]CUS37075.1 hypothetical protein COMA1_30395 [Candidatus Nitrospira nitrosa]
MYEDQGNDLGEHQREGVVLRHDLPSTVQDEAREWRKGTSFGLNDLEALVTVTGQRQLRRLSLFGQFLPVHKWHLAVRAYAAEGCAGKFDWYTRSGVHLSSVHSLTAVLD